MLITSIIKTLKEEKNLNNLGDDLHFSISAHLSHPIPALSYSKTIPHHLRSDVHSYIYIVRKYVN